MNRLEARIAKSLLREARRSL